MAPSRSRRAGIRRTIPLLAIALLVAAGVVAFGPLIPLPATGPTGAVTSPSPGPTEGAPAATTGPVASPSPSASPAASVRPTPHSSASPGPSPSRAPLLPVPTLTTATRRALQARLDQLRERYAIPGISAAIDFPDGSRWIGVSGLADVEAAVPVEPGTAFAIASISKTFTAALVLSLVDDGLVDLDVPARRYLPDVPKLPSTATVRQLLDHTSGLQDYFFHRDIDRLLLGDRDVRWEAARTLRFIGKPYFPPGRGWHYSNTNYFVLGLLAEAVGGAPIGDQVRTRLLDPLGLDRTWYQPGEAAGAPVAHAYRFRDAATDAPAIDLGDGSDIVPFTSVVTAAGAAGGFASTAGELARWARALYGRDDLLSDATRIAMIDQVATSRFKPTVPYGLGVQAVEIDGRRTFGHSGRLLGSRGAMRYLPDHDVAAVILTNQSRTDPAIILRSLLKIAFFDPTTQPAGPAPSGSPTPY